MPDNTREELSLLEQTKIIGAVKEMRKARDNHLIDETDFNNALIRMFQSEITKALQTPTRYSADGRGWIYAPDVDKLITKAQEHLLRELLASKRKWSVQDAEMHDYQTGTELEYIPLFIIEAKRKSLKETK